MRVILGVDSVKVPMAGIGVYSANLCEQFINNPDIEIQGLTRFKLLDKEALRSLLDTVHGATSSAAKGVGSNLLRLIASAAKDSDVARFIYHKGSQLASTVNLRGISDDTIYHAPNFIGYGQCARKVITVHDLSHLRFPDMHPKSRVRFMSRWLEKSVREASHIIVDTDFTRDELLRSGLANGVDENRISTIHLGVSDDYQARSDDEEQTTLAQLELNKRQYIFSLGTLEPRKNYERLINAYLSIPAEMAAHYPLVICGAKGWKYDSLLAQIKSVSSPHRVLLTGHKSRDDVVTLLRNCRVFAYPSLYEGFGLPILEAMKCGAPVITSDIGAMVEVAGNGAHLADPNSVASIADSLREVIMSDSLTSGLIDAGTEHVKHFTWERCANATLEVYEKL